MLPDFSVEYLRRAVSRHVDLGDLLALVKSEVDPNIGDIPLLWLSSMYDFLYTDPSRLWDRSAAEATFRGFNNMRGQATTFDAPYFDSLKYFFNAVIGYRDMMLSIRELEGITDNETIKTRVFRLPIYIGIVEGVISHLYKMMLHIIDFDGSKNLRVQSKLGPLVNLMNKYGLSDTLKGVNVDIRNAINHGAVLIYDNDLEFYHNVGGHENRLKLTFYKFDELIEEAIDTASGMILGAIRFHIINGINLDDLGNHVGKNSFTWNALMKNLLNMPGTRCAYVGENESPKRQVTIEIYTEIEGRAELMALGCAMAPLVRLFLPTQETYYFGFKGERILPSFIRFTNDEIDNFSASGDMTAMLISVVERQDQLIWGVQNKDGDPVKYKTFRFSDIKGEGWEAKDIEDCSIDGKKRFNVSLYVGNGRTREEIQDSVYKAIEAVRVLFNPPSVKTRIKHGSMPADAIYLNVYREHKRKVDRSLFDSNQNYILSAQYNTLFSTPLQEPGIVWRARKTERKGNIIYSWNPNFR